MYTGWFGGIYRGSEWIMRLAFLNILWIAFSLLGLVVLGLFPATVAMFAVTRKWVMGDTEIPIFKEFWEVYKAEFKQANLLGLIIVILGFFLYFDLRFTQAQDGLLGYLRFFFLGFILIYFVMTLYLFPVFTHYKLKTLEYIKRSFIFAIGRPLHSLIMVVFTIAVSYLMMFIPGLIPFYSGSVTSLLLMWGASLSFPKLVEAEE